MQENKPKKSGLSGFFSGLSSPGSKKHRRVDSEPNVNSEGDEARRSDTMGSVHSNSDTVKDFKYNNKMLMEFMKVAMGQKLEKNLFND